MYPVTPLSQYQLSISTMLALEAPITCTGNASAFFFAANLTPLSPAGCCFWGYSEAQWPSCSHLLQGNLFCVVSSSFHGFTGIHFHRIRLLLVIFMGNECCSFSQWQFVSSQLNCSELLNEQINSLCASMNSNANILETVVFLTKCGLNLSSQRIFNVLCQFVV